MSKFYIVYARWCAYTLVISLMFGTISEAQQCNMVLMDTAVANASASKCGYQQFTNANPDIPVVPYYLEDKTHTTYTYDNSVTGVDSNGTDDCSIAEPGDYDYETHYNYDATLTKVTDPVSCSESNTYSGSLSSDESDQDYTTWDCLYGDNDSGYTYDDHNDDFYSSTDDGTLSNIGWVHDAETFSSIYYISYDSVAIHLSDTTVTNGGSSFYTNSPDVAVYWVTPNVSPTSKTGSNTNIFHDGDTGTTTETLDNLFSDDQLHSKIESLMPDFPDYGSSGDGTAYSQIDDTHVDGTLQKLKYRFKIPNSSANTSYQVTWDIITVDAYDDGSGSTTSVDSNNSETIEGDGDPSGYAYGQDHTIDDPPFYCDDSSGGSETKYVANVSVQIINNNGSPGSGPGDSNDSDDSGCSTCGSGVPNDGGFHAQFGLGNKTFGQSAGILRLWAGTPSPLLSTPADLNFIGITNATSLIIISNQLRQVLAPQTLADIVTLNQFCYEINFYYSSQVGTLSNGLYLLSGSPFVSWTIENADSTNDCNNLVLLETRGSSTWQYTYNYNPTNNSWTYISPGGLRQVQRITTSNPDGTRVLTSITGNTNGSVTSFFSRVYKDFSWGEGVIAETNGLGADAKVTLKTYYDYGSYMPANGTFVPLQEVIHPDGSWEYYDYTQLADGTWVTQDIYRGYGDCSATDRSYSYDTYYDYTPLSSDDGTQDFYTPRTTTESLNENPISKSYLILLPGERDEIRCVRPNANWNDSDNLVTTNLYYTSGTNIFLVQSISNPDGTMSFYNYAQSLYGWQTNTVSSGQPNSGGTAIVDGTQTTTILDAYGKTVSVVTKDILSGSITKQDIYSNFDDLDRAQQITHLDGTSNLFEYACCYLEQMVDPDGLITVYLYDAAKRNIGYAKYVNGTNSITYENILDASGHILQAQRIGTDSSTITLSGSAYDTAGRLIVQTNALGGVTTYVESNDGTTGGLIRTTTFPNDGTRIEAHYVDGTLKSVTGTAMHGKAYGYGSAYDVNGNYCTYTTETNLDNGGTLTSEWTQTFTDAAGRTTEILYPDSSYSLSYYNISGQFSHAVDPDGVSTVYAYNGKGELTYTAVDMDQNGSIDFSASDRITQTTNDVIADHSTNVRRTRNYQWLDGQSTGTLISSTETSVDGLDTWQTQYRDTGTAIATHSQMVPGVSRTVTTTMADGSYSVSTYSYGRLVSNVRYSSTGTQIGGTSYGYDPQGRQNTITDARNGTTTLAFNNADLVVTNTTPNPGGGSPEVRVTGYNNMLQATSVTQPDNTVMNTVYLLTGELGLQYGSRTYPVAYSYDYAGRMATMTNWSNFGSLSGARVTSWTYDANRGWLTAKTYDGGAAGPAYTYTAAGRLASRTWARGITTSYGYDNAGGLTNVIYSDSTPGVTNVYDRLGRLSAVSWTNMTDTLSYNLANELTSESFSGGILNGLSVTNDYDQYLRRTNLTALASSLLNRAAYGYDNASRLSSVTDGNNNSATYSYVANSPLVSQIVFQQSGTTRMTTSKQYDYLNRLTQISSAPSSGSAITFNYNYNAANQRTHDTLADGSYWVYGYDSLGQVTNACKYFADGTPVAGQQFDYTFDTIGNRTQTKAGGDSTGANLRVANYTNNTLNQITSRDIPAYVDVMGASILTNAVTVNGSTAYRKEEYFRQQLNANNSASALWTNIIVSGGINVTGNVYVAKTPEVFKYDADGNLTNDGRWAYTWDGENRLKGMTVNTNVGPQYQLTFAYDAKGRRIQKVVATNGVALSTNNFLYDGWNLIAETRPDNSLIRSYVWGTDLSGTSQGAGGVGGLLEISYYGSSTTNCFPAYDGNGNIMALVNAADGTVAANYAYGPFGELIQQTGIMAKNNPIRFSTKYQDDESDLLYYGYRYYKPSTGSWLSKDPLQEKGGFNLYGFCGNNSVNNVDADGRIIPLILVTISIGNGVSHLIQACYDCLQCSKCTDRARATMNQAAALFGARDDAEGLANWLKAAQPGAECAPLCADCLKQALLGGKWVIGGVLLKYSIIYARAPGKYE